MHFGGKVTFQSVQLHREVGHKKQELQVVNGVTRIVSIYTIKLDCFLTENPPAGKIKNSIYNKLFFFSSPSKYFLLL